MKLSPGNYQSRTSPLNENVAFLYTAKMAHYNLAMIKQQAMKQHQLMQQHQQQQLTQQQVTAQQQAQIKVRLHCDVLIVSC